MPVPNPYATRLEEFSSFAFNDQDVYRNHGGWEKFFLSRMGRVPKRTILEIGCSNAEFLSDVAKDNPDVAFVGMDWKFKVLYKGAKRAHSMELSNIALLRGKAQELDKIFSVDELDEVWLFFPDPWAKKPQLKHRLFQEWFLLEAHKVLKPGGRFYFKTDHPGYFQWALSVLGLPQPILPSYDAPDPGERSRRARQIKVRRLEDDELPPQSEPVIERFRVLSSSLDYWSEQRLETLFSERQTLFEKLFIKERLPIYYIALEKNNRPELFRTSAGRERSSVVRTG